MSTSELRRGPGWWMDPEGQWNPPEAWPESSPPLPGWTRTPNGTWSAPRSFRPSIVSDDDEATAVDAVDIDAEMPDKAPVAESTSVPTLASLDGETLTHHKPKKTLGLAFSDSTVAVVQPDVDLRRSLRRAVGAMIIAALTASMIAAGLILLLLLL